MSRLEELISDLCPDGVEYKCLADAVNVARGVRVVKNQLTTDGAYPVYQNSRTSMGFYEESNCPADTTFIIGAGAAGEIGYSYVDFWAADDCFYFDCPKTMQSRYLYHTLLNQQRYIFSRVRRASIPRLARTVVERLFVPVPPLEIQMEIVKILDNFTKLTAEHTAELTAELTARKKQYEYYRDFLMKDKSFELKSLNEIGIMKRGTYVTKKSIGTGNIPVILGGQQPAYYCDSSNHDGEAIVISRSGAYAGFVSFWNEPIFVTDGFIIETTNRLKLKFLYYYLRSIQNSLHQSKRGSGVPHVRGSEIMKIEAPFPPLEEQERIIAILDRFDTLCNDLTSGLPAEIEARRKQYEYYRDKLLAFKEASA